MILEEKRNNNEEEYITIDLSGNESTSLGKRSSRTNKEKKARIGKSKKDKKSKISKKKIALIIASVIAVVIILVGISFGKYVYQAEGDVKKAVLNMASDVAVNIVGNDEPIFVLVLGISEDITSKLTDTIMVGGYNPETQKAFLVSIPRDTFVGTNEATASGWDKINALYQKDVTRTIKAVEERTGLNIENYVVVRNTMLPALVNAIGEVEFDVPIDMDYDDPTQDLHIHLKAGVQMIDGDKAEQLLRFRHNNNGTSYPSSYGDNDYGRMKTQREFIKVVAKQLININNVGKLKSIAEAVFGNLETNMSIGDMIGYIPYAIGFNVEDLRMEQLPGSGAMLNKLSFYKASHTRSKALMDELIEYLSLDEKETKKYYTGKIKQTVAASAEEDACEHNYISEITKEPTCDKEGERTYTCTKCKGTYIEPIATSNHNYNSNGVCTACGNDKKIENHTCKFTKEIAIELEASCYMNGSGWFACEICGEKEKIAIKATGNHTYGYDGICTTDGCTAKKETSEGNNTTGNTTNPEQTKPTVPSECAHTNTSETKIDATCAKTGSITIKCKDCGTIISTETLPKTTNHNFSDTTKATCGNPGCTEPNTNYVPPALDSVTPPDTTPTSPMDPGTQEPAA